ncbi:hypothetical protein CG699_12870, partial [Escherichia coli]
GDFELLLCHGTVCVVGKIRDLILQLSKSSIYSTKPYPAKRDEAIRHNNYRRSNFHLFHVNHFFRGPFFRLS